MSEKISCAARFAAVRCQMANAFCTNALTFDSGKSGAEAESIRASIANLRPSVVMARALSSRGSTFCERIRS